MLDPDHRRHLEALGLAAGWRCLEVGAGNGSMSAWLARKVAPGGHVVAVDLDTRLAAALASPNLEVREQDVTRVPPEAGAYDLVTARAVLHHLPERWQVVESMAAALRPGGWLLVVEPDFAPLLVVEPPAAREFWQSWVDWAAGEGIDYYAGRAVPARLVRLGMEDVGAVAVAPVFRGGSLGADYWRRTLQQLRPRLLGSGAVREDRLEAVLGILEDPAYWMMANAYTTTWGRRPARS